MGSRPLLAFPIIQRLFFALETAARTYVSRSASCVPSLSFCSPLSLLSVSPHTFILPHFTAPSFSSHLYSSPFPPLIQSCCFVQSETSSALPIISVKRFKVWMSLCNVKVHGTHGKWKFSTLWLMSCVHSKGPVPVTFGRVHWECRGRPGWCLRTHQSRFGVRRRQIQYLWSAEQGRWGKRRRPVSQTQQVRLVVQQVHESFSESKWRGRKMRQFTGRHLFHFILFFFFLSSQVWFRQSERSLL